jgi:AcrR family transcriptional regulator
VLGPRARKTREKLLEATKALVNERPIREVSVIEIARRVGTSPATFYQYFKDVEEAVLMLAEQAAEAMPSLLHRLDRSWDGPEGLEHARAVVAAFIDHWDEHRAVLRFRDLAAEEGDPRFQRIRTKALLPPLDHLANRIEESRKAGRVSGSIHNYAAAAAMLAILERLAAYYGALEPLGVNRETLTETCARILHQTVTGEPGD